MLSASERTQVKRSTLSMLAVVIACAAMGWTALYPSAPDPQSSTVIVQARHATSAAEAVHAVGGRVLSTLSSIDAVGAQLNAEQLATLQEQQGLRIHANRAVWAAGKDKDKDDSAGDAAADPKNDELVGSSQHWVNEVDAVHAMGIDGSGITIGFVDTGLWKQSSSRNRVLAAIDVTGLSTPDFQLAEKLDDDFGHGTHIASVATGSSSLDNGSPIGVAPGANLVIVRAFDDKGSGTYLDVIEGIDWLIANRESLNLRVLNLSFGAEAQSAYWDDPLNQAVMAAWEAGIVVVASAGNFGPEPMTVSVPGNLPYVITVGAMTDAQTPGDVSDDILMPFSSAGPTAEGFIKPELLAPGAGLWGEVGPDSMLAKLYRSQRQPGSHHYALSGTSQAAAVVSGLSALLLQAKPGLSPDNLKCQLMDSAHVALKSPEERHYAVFQQGAGRVSALDALNSVADGCANRGLDVSADRSGSAHFMGPAVQDEQGQYTLVDEDGQAVKGSGFSWDGGYSSAQGYGWTGSQSYFMHTQGYGWTGEDSSGEEPGLFLWSQGYGWTGNGKDNQFLNIWNRIPGWPYGLGPQGTLGVQLLPAESP